MLVKILKILAGFFGSLLLAVGIMSGFLFFVTNNLVNNADNFDKVIKDTSGQFLEQNRDEIRDFVKEKIEGQPLPEKEELAIACQNPQIVPENLKGFLATDFCENLNSMSQDEVNDKVFDYLIDTNVNGLIEAASNGENTQEVKTQIKELGGPLVNPTVLIGPVVIALLGAILLMASTGFRLLTGFYKISLKTAIVLMTITIFLLIVRLLSVNAFMSFLLMLQDLLNVELPELGPVILKFIVTIIINWLRLAMNPLLPWVALSMMPFIIASIFLYIKQRHAVEEAKKEIEKKEIVKA